MPLRKICLLGSSGLSGAAMLEALVKDGSFEVTLIQRSNKSSKDPAAASSAKQVTVSPEFTLEELTAAFSGHDAVVVSIRPRDIELHKRIVEAAYAAGVKRFVPPDFGSCDSASPRAQSLLNLYRIKAEIQRKCEEMAAKSDHEGGVFTWSSLVCGHFFDYGLHNGLLHFDLNAHTGDLLDGGDIPASASTLPRVAESLVHMLHRPDATRNRVLYAQSFCVTQRQILASLEKATNSKWTTNSVSSDAYLAELKPKADAGDHQAVEDIVFVVGTIEANWPAKGDAFGMDVLGLKDENLDEVVAAAVAENAKGKQ